jgi:hypothetical protein
MREKGFWILGFLDFGILGFWGFRGFRGAVLGLKKTGTGRVPIPFLHIKGFLISKRPNSP